jgi:hypothetical protein
MQALKLSWTEVGYREPSGCNAHAAAALDGKWQRLNDSTQAGRGFGRASSARSYRRGLRLDGSQCLLALDGHLGHPDAAQPGAASSSGGVGSGYRAGVAHGVAAARQQVFAGVTLEPASDDSDGGQELGGGLPAGAARRRDSTRWLMTLHSPYLAALDPGTAGLGRPLYRMPDGVALRYSLIAGSETPHPCAAAMSSKAQHAVPAARSCRLF